MILERAMLANPARLAHIGGIGTPQNTVMSALANHAFVKMNGIGNEIVVVDMRAHPAAISADEARAIAAPEGAPYDQLMALYPPRVAGNRELTSASTTMTAPKPAPAATACAASRRSCPAKPARMR